MRLSVFADEVIEFAAGTRTWLDRRGGTTALRRLAARLSS